MGLIKTYPVGQGNHNNTHFLAKDKKKGFTFKIVCFHDSGEAFIMGSNITIDPQFLNAKAILEAIKEDLERKWDFVLKSEQFEMFMSFENTEHLLKYYNAKEKLLNENN